MRKTAQPTLHQSYETLSTRPQPRADSRLVYEIFCQELRILTNRTINMLYSNFRVLFIGEGIANYWHIKIYIPVTRETSYSQLDFSSWSMNNLSIKNNDNKRSEKKNENIDKETEV